MTKKEARAYLKRLASAGRIVRDGVAYRAMYGKSRRTARRMEGVMEALGGAVWGYEELQTRRSKFDNWRTWCEVTFAPSVEDDPLMNMEVLRCKSLT